MKCLHCKSKSSVVMAKMTLVIETNLRKGGSAKFGGISAMRTAELWEAPSDPMVTDRELRCNECNGEHTYNATDGLVKV